MVLKGPVYIYDRFRKLANLEKCMIDRDCAYLYIEKNEFSREEEIKNLRSSYSNRNKPCGF